MQIRAINANSRKFTHIQTEIHTFPDVWTNHRQQKDKKEEGVSGSGLG